MMTADREELAGLLPRSASYMRYARETLHEETLKAEGARGHHRLPLNTRIAGMAPDDVGSPERVLTSIMDLYKLASRRWPFSFEQNIYFLDFIAGHVPRLWKTEMAAIGARLRQRFRLPEPAQVTCVLTGRRRGKTTISAMQIAICLICMPRFTCLVFCPSMNLAQETYQTVLRILDYFISALGIADAAADGHPYAFDYTNKATPHPVISVGGPGSLANKNERRNEVSFFPSISKNGQVRARALFLSLFFFVSGAVFRLFRHRRRRRTRFLSFFFLFILQCTNVKKKETQITKKKSNAAVWRGAGA